MSVPDVLATRGAGELPAEVIRTERLSKVYPGSDTAAVDQLDLEVLRTRHCALGPGGSER